MKRTLLLLATVLFFISANGQTAEEYFVRGLEKDELQDYRGAIADYSKAIELNPNYEEAYNNRGMENSR